MGTFIFATQKAHFTIYSILCFIGSGAAHVYAVYDVVHPISKENNVDQETKSNKVFVFAILFALFILLQIIGIATLKPFD